MSTACVQTILDYINAFAPFETAEAYDNVGLLVGRAGQPVSRILCSLDVTMDTVREAQRLGAELIVSHHPLMFHAIKNLREGAPEADILCELVRSRLCLISAHTNWDQTVLSGSACVARAVGLQELRQDGYLFTGSLDKPLTALALAQRVRDAIHAPVRLYGRTDREVRTISFAGGAYGEGYLEAQALGAQAYLTGEVRHHEITDAVARDMVLLDAGHYASEAPMIPALRAFLEEKLAQDHLACQVFETTCVPFPGALEIKGGTP